jgi:ligand-binding SRPBCC domain-containing protein
VSESYSFSISTPLQASAQQVWAHASTFAGVNRELWPIAQMTFPPAMRRLTPEAIPLGRTAFRSWILLFGLVPVEFDDFMLVDLEPGRGFSEVSRMLGMREWRHRRNVESAGGGCVLRDEVTMLPRWPWIGWLQAQVYQQIFQWRHRTLRRLFRAARAVAAGPDT